MMDEGTTALVVAGISASVSILVAVSALVSSLLTANKTASNDAKLATLESGLRDVEAARNARLDYEYEALKHLYSECEPLLFQFFELADDAESRIRALARECRNGSLRPDGSGWLADPSYYFDSTVYRLSAPLAAIRILQRRLTAVDLDLDSRLKTQYRLLRILYRSITDDQAIAERNPRLPYDPDSADPEDPDRDALIAADPQKYLRQGMYRGNLDRLVDAMIIREQERERVMSFGEFLQFKRDSRTELFQLMPYLELLLIGFHPTVRPVLWRVLVTQKLLYDALRASRDLDRSGPTNLDALVARGWDATLTALDWRKDETDADNEAVSSPMSAARMYIVETAQA